LRSWIIEYPSEVGDQPAIVNLAEPFRILFELRKRLPQLCLRAIEISPAEVMKSDSRLDQTLIEEPKRPAGRAPQILPGFVGLEVTPGIEKKYSVPQKIAHSAVPSKLLIK